MCLGIGPRIPITIAEYPINRQDPNIFRRIDLSIMTSIFTMASIQTMEGIKPFLNSSAMLPQVTLLITAFERPSLTEVGYKASSNESPFPTKRLPGPDVSIVSHDVAVEKSWLTKDA